jgi:hypothetical protein
MYIFAFSLLGSRYIFLVYVVFICYIYNIYIYVLAFSLLASRYIFMVYVEFKLIYF